MLLIIPENLIMAASIMLHLRSREMVRTTRAGLTYLPIDPCFHVVLTVNTAWRLTCMHKYRCCYTKGPQPRGYREISVPKSVVIVLSGAGVVDSNQTSEL